jgi:hypothetical protein
MKAPIVAQFFPILHATLGYSNGWEPFRYVASLVSSFYVVLLHNIDKESATQGI